MSISDDEYFFQEYHIGWYEENEGPPLIKKRSRLIAAAYQNNVELVKELLDSPKWYKVRDKFGYNILHISILCENSELFDHLLMLEDFPLEEIAEQNQTALVTALNGFVSNDIPVSDDYYALELLKKDVNVKHLVEGNNTLLHCALERDFFRVAEKLVEKGVDVNIVNDDGYSTLHLAVKETTEHLVPLLLFYGADPWLPDNSGLTAFDRSICLFKSSNLFIQQELYNYMFDEFTAEKLDISTVLCLSTVSPVLFHTIIDNDVKVKWGDVSGFSSEFLFTVETDHLKILLEKCNHIVKAILKQRFRPHSFLRQGLNISVFLKNLNLLLQSNVSEDASNLVQRLRARDFVDPDDPERTTEVILYLLSYGMKVDYEDLQKVYCTYGFNFLFKALLYMDISPCFDQILTPLPFLICNVSWNFDRFMDHWKNSFSDDALISLTPYYANKKLQQYILERKSELVEEIGHVPLLVELARNSARQWIVEVCKTKTSRGFYTVLERLPIPQSMKNIISLQTPLYTILKT